MGLLDHPKHLSLAMSDPEERPRSKRPFGAVAAVAALLFIIFFFAIIREQDQDTRPKWKAKTTEQVHAVDNAPWLLATMSPADGIGRRILIRETWQRLYANSSRFDMRFIISNATDLFWPYVQEENKTHGDLLMLEHLQETRKVANTIKPMEFLKALTEGQLLRPYSFVSKIDDDTFLDATTFYDRYLAPRLKSARENNMQLSPSVIGKKIHGAYTWDYPAGAFYTLSWDLVCGAVAAYAFNGTQGIKDEDALIGKLVADSELQFEFIGFSTREVSDYVTPEGRVWAEHEEELDAYYHPLAPGAIQVHNLKSTEHWVQVSKAFDKNGFRTSMWREHVDVNEWFRNRTHTSSHSSTVSKSRASTSEVVTPTGNTKSQHTDSFTSVVRTTGSTAATASKSPD